MKATKYLRKNNVIKSLEDDGKVINTQQYDSINLAKKASTKLQGTLGDGSLRLDVA